MKKSRTVVVLRHSKPVSKTKDSTADPVFCAEYEKEAVKQDVLAAFAKADREAPKNTPFDHLQDAHTLLVADKDYRSRYDRIGAAATENAWDDQEDKPNPVQVLESFRTTITAGVIPDTNTLIFVAKCFAVYLEGKGKVSLDVAFGMPSKQRVGNPAQHKAKLDDEGQYLFRMAVYRGKNPEKTIRDAAVKIYLEDHAKPGATEEPNNEALSDEALKFIDTMTGYYSTRGWTETEKQMDGGRITFSPYSAGRK